LRSVPEAERTSELMMATDPGLLLLIFGVVMQSVGELRKTIRLRLVGTGAILTGFAMIITGVIVAPVPAG
jgi:hypothetical protein